ncbi:hypothetical protein SCHPADRAFT_992542 [Schizopora paradoxa]|uniref:Pentacotripeptide-repeat region of PRORP domain-containing protein n=1 Tax=Schizopora paradoxa TaxID=27342 RepID=A0A0H2SE30_9AGAM|nr:hypothetical protein SCHPADRAFT_992542 [Schizopora paradoxa]
MLRHSFSSSGCRTAFACVAGPSAARIPFSTSFTSREVEEVTATSKPSKPFLPKKKPQAGSRSFKQVYRANRIVSKEDNDEKAEQLKTLAGQSLRPAVLSARMKLLCRAKGYDDALQLLKEAPFGVQIPVVWNTLISEVMHVHKYGFAYVIFTEMKRRGVKPNLMTYATMMMGYGQIEDWSQFRKQLENCMAVYDHFHENRNQIETKTQGTGPASMITCKYITILSRANLHDKIFDVFNQMDTHGAWAPNAHVFGAILGALIFRFSLKSGDVLAAHERNASDAKLLFRQMKESESRGVPAIDEYVVGRLLTLLGRGRPADQQFALEIAREYAGYASPGEAALPPKVTVSPELRLSILLLLRRLRRSRLILSYSEQLLEVDDKHIEVWGRHVLESFHDIATKAPSDESEKALELLRKMLLEAARRDSKKLRPTMHNYETALMVCWRCADWKSACDIFHLMTGYDASEFTPPSSPSESQDPAPEPEQQSPKPIERSEGLNLTPSNLAMLNLVRTAVASENRDAMLQCWEIYLYFFKGLPPRGSGWNSYRLKPYEHAPYFNLAFARSIAKLVDKCLTAAGQKRAVGLIALREWAQKTIDDSHTQTLSVPYMERLSKDSEDEGPKLKEAVDFEMQLRSSA